MIKLICVAGVLLLNTVNSISQVNVLDASTLPANLKVNAHSVKREEKIEFEVRSISDARLTVHQVFTVLDIAGESDLHFVEYSDKFRELSDAEIKVFDANGKQLNKYKKKEMNAESIGDGLITDAKEYYFQVSAPGYPITVQYDYEVKYHGTYQYPDFKIQNPEQGVESTSFTAIVPADLGLRYKPKNINLAPSISTEGKNKIYSWTVKNLFARKSEDGAGSIRSCFPTILLGATKFNYDDNPGDMSSWKTLGLWYNSLVKEINVLPDNMNLQIQSLVKNASTEKEKVKIIYQYLQNNYRYVSIQLGIGGLKPFAAKVVHEKKYGDCKALSNYMEACLKAVNIKSYSVWITADTYPPDIDPAFPYDYFNHQILCVPFVKDTIWLECTSNTCDFGELSSSTQNRYGLLLTENGGVLVKTPDSKPSENLFTVNTNIKLEDDASGKSTSTVLTTGEYKQLMMEVSSWLPDRQKTFVVNYEGFPTPDDYKLFFKKLNERDYATTVELQIEKIPDFSAGSKMFLNPRIYKLWGYSLPKSEKRIGDFYFDQTFTKTDTTVYNLPEGYTVETLPKPRNLKTEFSSFKTSYVFNEKEKTITTSAVLVLNQNKIPADKFEATRRFFSDVIDEYTDKIVIKKNTP